LLSGLALCVAVLFATAPGAAAQENATPTPDLSVAPASPTGATLENERTRICWTDASDNEKGFTVSVGFCDRQFDFTVGADVKCFDLPPEAQISAFPEYCVGAYQFWVGAFNDAGRSFPVVISIPVRKGEPPPATPTPSVETAPATGGAPSTEGHYPSAGVLALSAAGAMLLIVGALVRVMRSMNRDKSNSP